MFLAFVFFVWTIFLGGGGGGGEKETVNFTRRRETNENFRLSSPSERKRHRQLDDILRPFLSTNKRTFLVVRLFVGLLLKP
jgi:hypothetical protein